MLPRARVRTRDVDDMHYDASEEESISEMENESKDVIFEEAIAILEAPSAQRRSVSEPIPPRKTWAGKQVLRPRPLLTGNSTSEDEDPKVGGKTNATRQYLCNTEVVQRRASWPQPPLTPKAHDSGVQGLDDSDTDTAGNGFEHEKKGTRHWRNLTEPDILALSKVEDEEEDDDDEDGSESVAFRGIADADSSEERWRQIVLEEHMDKIFNALPILPDEELREMVEDGVVVRASFETTDEWGIPRRKKSGLKEQILTLLRLFGCMRA
jgi:hypothetical protein